VQQLQNTHAISAADADVLTRNGQRLADDYSFLTEKKKGSDHRAPDDDVTRGHETPSVSSVSTI